MNKATLWTVLFSFAAATPRLAHSFSVDGFTSGMSPDQVIAIAKSRGLDTSYFMDNLVISNRSKDQVYGTMVFCKGHLFVYDSEIDFDADYLTALQGLLSRYGQPASVGVDVENATGIGYVRVARLTWRSGDDRVDLSFMPDVRDGKGAVRYTSSANVSYTARTSCNESAFAR